MSKRWILGLVAALLLLFLAWAGWRLSIWIPGKLRGVEEEIVSAAAGYGLGIRHGGLRFHLLHLYLSMDDLEIRDEAADRFLARAGDVEVSLSPLRLLRGELPVSRIRIRNYRIEAGERNRALYERLRESAKKEGDAGMLPEILLVDGTVRVGPLGPVRRLDAVVRELRVRERRFLGTRVDASVANISGEIAVPGDGIAAWPYPSMEAEIVRKGSVLKIRKARAWGGASEVRLSGFLETDKRLAEGKLSGEVDLAKWIAGGFPGAGFARLAVRSGKVEFSAAASGPWDDPEGGAKIVLRKGNFQGTSVEEGEASLSLRGRVARIDRAHAKLLGGDADAAGSWRIDTAAVDWRGSLRRFSLAAVPWKELGIPLRFSGTADLSLSVSGTPDRLRGEASLTLPEGVERLPERDGEGFRFRAPLSAEIAATWIDGKTVRAESFLLKAGRAEVRGEGDFRTEGRELRLRGTAQAAAGKAGDYGIAYPVSWDGIAGEWEIAGPASRLRTSASLRVPALKGWSLPPVPLAAKLDGVPSEALHFVADVPSDSFKITAVGTAESLSEPAKARADIAVTAREVELADAGMWVSAILASLGEEPGTVREYLDGAKGSADADGRIELAPGRLDLSGRIRSKKAVVRGIPLASVRAEGEYGRTGEGDRWAARGEGKVGDGLVRAGANGAAGEATAASAEIAGLRISQALSFLPRRGIGGVDGIVDARIEARGGPGGWEFPIVAAESREISIGDARISGVRAEGTLGADNGAFVIETASPRGKLSGNVRSGGEWPAKFALSVASLPTSFLMAAAGRPSISAEGTWSAEGQGTVLLRDLAAGRPVSPEMFPSLRASLRAEGPAAGSVRFREIRASGIRDGEVLSGELITAGPDTRLEWMLALREPFGFRLEGPFTIGDSTAAASRDEKRRFSVRGQARVEGALRALDRTRGSIRVDSLTYREGGWELAGKDLEASMDPEGVRWEGGTLVAAGSPVRISGKASWSGDIDARIDGKLPAGVVRLAVPGVFDRLDGVMTLEVRVTGNLTDPVIVGAGRLEKGVLSFRGYAQQFEELKADAVLSREKIVFEHFEGRSGGGYIDGWGEVPLNVDAGQRLFFSVDFFDMAYPYPQELRPVLQGHVELIGPVMDFLVTGDVEVQSARYTKNIYPERALLDFRRRMSDVSARREKSEFRVRLDIDAIADRTIRIRNNVADISASGEFKVQGDAENVIILGSFDAYEGSAEFYGNRYEIKRLTVDFQDPRRLNPRLDARAETRKGNYTIAVLVTGTLEKPEVDFTSDPPLGRTDIVSLLSFGVTTQALLSPTARPSSSIGPAGGAAIAIGSIGGVDEKISGAVGLDKFTIETGFSQTTQSFEPRLVMKKSFEDRASVSFTQSVGTSSEASATGELRLHEHVYLEGGWQSPSASTSGQISGDLKLKYRFQSLKGLLNGRN
ncbi:MAG: translocation/assembly module TamB domain-containing protein [Thermodesulfobacteriota bacterium]